MGVPGLSEWLKALSLEDRSREVIAWCEEQGAATLTEVAENREELAHVLGDIPELKEGGALTLAELVSQRIYSHDLEEILIALISVLDEDRLQHVEISLKPGLSALLARLALRCRQAPPASCSPGPQGSAASGCLGDSRAPRGIALTAETASQLSPGDQVVLHVLAGRWQGWHICEVLEVRTQSFYLRHVEDGFEENIPWALLGGGSYHIELLGQDSHVSEPSYFTKTSQVEVTAAPYISRRDARLLRLAERVVGSQRGARGADELCDGCGRSAWRGQRSREDGALYCDECWAEWPDS